MNPGTGADGNDWTGNFWWVCQGDTYDEARTAGWVYAPLTDQRGAKPAHYTRVGEMRKGDIVIHWGRPSGIYAIGVAASNAETGTKPHSTERDDWEEEGYKCKIDYFELTTPIKGSEFENTIRKRIYDDDPYYHPFNVSLGCKQAYMSGVPSYLATWLQKNFADRIPDNIPGWDALCNAPTTSKPRSPTVQTGGKTVATSGAELIDELLNINPQIILAGPPGTSKTWTAMEAYLKSYKSGERFREGASDNVQWEIVQFHQNYGYEDFIVGIKAKTVNEQLTFEDTQGIFLRMAREANLPHNQDKSYYLIIDEINRGVLSRIFGELILSLEYRELEVHLPGQSEPLIIPKNLYLIGTMNTADRNIALVDHALRRRFLMQELLPDIDVLHNYAYPTTDLKNKALNAFEIVNQLFYDGEKNAYRIHNGYAMKDYAVGHTYFLAQNNITLETKLRNQVIPLLEEYQREGILSKEDVSTATNALRTI